jgi:glycosyltransferase involved in cell wall biosynthesis
MHIGYLSFRIAGTDGVSLEAERWKIILERMGHQVTMIAGELDRPGYLLPNIHFTRPHIHELHEAALWHNSPYSKHYQELRTYADDIAKHLYEFFYLMKFDHLIIANALSLPIHFTLAPALLANIIHHHLPTTSRNHDFWWERPRYHNLRSWRKYFTRYFPPQANGLIQHVTINKIAQKDLKTRTGIDSTVIGDSFDFDAHHKLDSFNRLWRQDFGLKPNDIVFLQATRIIPRKQIELAIDLVHKLKDQRIVLVLAGYSGDEGNGYESQLKQLIQRSGIRSLFIGDQVTARRSIKHGRRYYTLWDCFLNADFVTYPSSFEGFGNQFIEAIFFKKPVFVNRYDVYKTDLEPLGFATVAIDGQVTDQAVSDVKHLLSHPGKVKSMVNNNFNIARNHFSFTAAQKKLQHLGF